MKKLKESSEAINPAFKEGFLDGLAAPLNLFASLNEDVHKTTIRAITVKIPTDNIARAWRNVGTSLNEARLKHRRFINEKIAY